MPRALDIGGLVFRNGSAVMLARIVGSDGNPLVPATIASAKYTIVSLDPNNPNLETPIAGHTAVALTPSAILFATLQTGGLWDFDTTGYNFLHELDVSANQAFATAGLWYRICYDLTPTSGQVIVARFKVQAQ